MTVMTSHRFHAFCWLDLVTTDHRKAIEFYHGLFDWSFRETLDGGQTVYDWSLEETVDDGSQVVYSMGVVDGELVAGIGELPPGDDTPPNWTPYICVEDVGATVAQCEGAGGQVIMPPVEVFDAGVMAVIMDPAGAPVGLWQPKAHTGFGRMREHGTVHWMELDSTDASQAKGFFHALLGWSTEADELNPDYTLFALEGVELAEKYLGGLMQMTEDWGDIPSHWLTYFGVNDVERTFSRALELGGEKITEVLNSPHGRFAILKDPLGAVFALMELDDESA